MILYLDMEFYDGKVSENNNMGLMRYVLAFAVLLAHFNYVFDTQWWFPVSSYHGVGGFFTMSGFLVYGSYSRSRGFAGFLSKRARKILPPYYFIVLACAFLLYFTVEAPLRTEYFSWPWVKYVVSNLCFLNFLAPTLPGVFDGMPVNGSLWTIKIEWALYLSVPLFVVLLRRVRRWSPVYMIFAIYILSGAYRLLFIELYLHTEKEIYDILSRQFFGQLGFFYSGVLIYLMMPLFLRYKWRLAAVSLIMIVLGSRIPGFDYFIEPLAIAVLVMSLSLCKGVFRLFNTNNFSYEVYLFHMPVLLLLHQYLPTAMHTDAIALMAAVLIVGIMSAVCWFLLDRPLLQRGLRLRA